MISMIKYLASLIILMNGSSGVTYFCQLIKLLVPRIASIVEHLVPFIVINILHGLTH
jgi:hypothetical protein